MIQIGTRVDVLNIDTDSYQYTGTIEAAHGGEVYTVRRDGGGTRIEAGNLRVLLDVDTKVHVCAELGINAGGDMDVAERLIAAAAAAGANSVKWQTRTIERVFTAAELGAARSSPFGTTNGDLKRGLEWSPRQLADLARYARSLGLATSSSPWDERSVETIVESGCDWIKVPSPRIGHVGVLREVARCGMPVVLSTGMSSTAEVRRAAEALGSSLRVLAHCVSAYPAPASLLRYSRASWLSILARQFGVAFGYSGHEEGAFASLYSVARLDARFVERHLTLDRSSWGSDHKASMEPGELAGMVREIRALEASSAMVDLDPHAPHPLELAARAKLWREEDVEP